MDWEMEFHDFSKKHFLHRVQFVHKMEWRAFSAISTRIYSCQFFA